MKNLVVLAGLIAAASTGCIISSDDTSSGNAHVGATWRIMSLASNAEIGCPPGYDTAALYNQPVDNNDQAVGSPIIDLFDCAAGAGTSAPLPPDRYETYIEITTHTNTGAPYAQSVPAYVDVTDVDMTYSADIFDDAGYFAMAWDLVGKNTGAPLTCADAGVTGSSSGIDLLLNVTGTMSMDMDEFPCEDGQGISKAFPAATYTVSVDAFNSGGQVSDSVVKDNVVLDDHNAVKNLGSVSIPITGL